MQALTQVHMRHNQISPRQFFEAAYMNKFRVRITELALTNDVKQFEESGKIPAYVTDWLVKTYGAQ